MRHAIRDNALSVFFLALFLLALVGQSIAGYLRTTSESVAHGETPVDFGAFVTLVRFPRRILGPDPAVEDQPSADSERVGASVCTVASSE